MSDYWKKKLDELNQGKIPTTNITSGSKKDSSYWANKIKELDELYPDEDEKKEEKCCFGF